MSSRERRQAGAFYLFISPWLLGFVFLSIVPLLVGLFISFSNYDGLNLMTTKWVGLRNYTRALGDTETQYALQPGQKNHHTGAKPCPQRDGRQRLQGIIGEPG